MRLFHYIKIKNFKTFGNEIEVKLDQPSVLIGPNNSGKTSVLQALSLWSFGVKNWYEAKGNSLATKNISVGINRLNLTQLPVQNARFLWKNTDVRKGSNELIPLEITIGVEYEGQVYPCLMRFIQQSSEIIYCSPDKEFYENKELIGFAAKLTVNLLYSMSGVAVEEVLLQEGRVNSLLGQGQTSEVLRNLCYMVYENHRPDWEELVGLMKKLFQIELSPPKNIASKGTLELKYKAADVKNNLDIAMAGRGLQQFLLLFSYLFSHKKSILLLDEPDAHIEILRQKTVFTVLKNLTQKNGNQLIIATHSEVILNEAADTNLELILMGESIHLADKKEIKKTLMDFGVEHYYKAKEKKSILYIEGNTDIDMLREFATLVENNKARDILDSNFNYYYTQNTEPENTILNEIERNHGYYDNNFLRHFKALQSIVPEIKGIAIFDGDGIDRPIPKINNLKVIYWKRYELENYFINPGVIGLWSKKELHKHGELDVYFEKALSDCIVKNVFNNNVLAFDEYQQLPTLLKGNYWLNNTKQLKLSGFFEDVLRKYSHLSVMPIPLNKGNFYTLIPYLPVNEVDEDIKNVLMLLIEYLGPTI